MKFYVYPKCSTCRKAIKYLTDAGLAVDAIDISISPPSKDELVTMLGSYGGKLNKLFNTSGMLYRELNMKDKLPSLSVDEALTLLTENGMLIKRPFLLTDNGQGVVGFKEDQWRNLSIF